MDDEEPVIYPPIPGLFAEYEGETVPVTNMYNADGLDTTDVARCDRYVAGPLSDGSWICSYPENAPIIVRN